MSTSLQLILISALLFESAMATTFTLLNNCDYTVWPGILSNAGVAQLSSTGFALSTGQSQQINLPSAWAGRLWARTLCSTSPTGTFSCQTGDCGSGTLACSGAGASPPATLAEFTLDGYGGQDFYDVSLVDGYNLPLLVAPAASGTGPNCSYTGCITDLNGACPSDLKVMSDDGSQSVACKSACGAFNQPQYCCTGAYGSPDTCKASSYSQAFKSACPRAYSYAYDDRTSTFICGNSPDYTITFCPSPSTSQKATATATTEGTPTATAASLVNSSMVYEGALDMSSAGSLPITWAHVMAGVGATALWAMVCHRLF